MINRSDIITTAFDAAGYVEEAQTALRWASTYGDASKVTVARQRLSRAMELLDEISVEDAA
ncbi:hypothetical protein JI664_12835 [Rhodobacter sp. NTK016B]|uniref:hypothetical protein n=1 Tax=Rhodobacter sp. NTK016B TaxID=2759676 RepID=UPI001A8C55CC|nr:hypothetical protein [Rhodobacter sp. NTK016B]MBN8292853.1 hypothetical protein [Rhodobacter sp. NTK016B]